MSEKNINKLKEYANLAGKEYNELISFFGTVRPVDLVPRIKHWNCWDYNYNNLKKRQEFFQFCIYIEQCGNRKPAKNIGLFSRNKPEKTHLCGILMQNYITEQQFYENLKQKGDKFISRFENEIPQYFEMACYYDFLIREFGFYDSNKSVVAYDIYREFGELYCQEQGIDSHVLEKALSNMSRSRDEILSRQSDNLHERLELDFGFYKTYLASFCTLLSRISDDEFPKIKGIEGIPDIDAVPDENLLKIVEINHGKCAICGKDFPSNSSNCYKYGFRVIQYVLALFSNSINTTNASNYYGPETRIFYNDNIGRQNVCEEWLMRLCFVVFLYLKHLDTSGCSAVGQDKGDNESSQFKSRLSVGWYNILYYFVWHASRLGRKHVKIIMETYKEMFECMVEEHALNIQSPEKFLSKAGIDEDCLHYETGATLTRGVLDLTSSSAGDLLHAFSLLWPANERAEELNTLKEDYLVLAQKIFVSTSVYEEAAYSGYYFYKKTNASNLCQEEKIFTNYSKQTLAWDSLPTIFSMLEKFEDMETRLYYLSYCYSELVGLISDYLSFIVVKDPATSPIYFICEKIIKYYNEYILSVFPDADFLFNDFKFQDKFTEVRNETVTFFNNVKDFVGSGDIYETSQKAMLVKAGEEVVRKGYYSGFAQDASSVPPFSESVVFLIIDDIIKNCVSFVKEEQVITKDFTTSRLSGKYVLSPKMITFLEQIFGRAFYNSAVGTKVADFSPSEKKDDIEILGCSLSVEWDEFAAKYGEKTQFSAMYFKLYENIETAALNYFKNDTNVMQLSPKHDARMKSLYKHLASKSPYFKKDLKAINASNSNKIRDEKALKDALKKLDQLTGLSRVKKEIRDKCNEVQASMMAQKMGTSVKLKLMPAMLFVGPPGTGKTTVGELVGEIFYQLGILKTNKVTRIKRDSDTIGTYIGQTEEKVQKILERAKGGVLFVDEAYQFYSPDDSKDYGKKVIEMIMDVMESNPNDYLVIMAGYEQEMEKLMDVNKGLKSRFTTKIHFEEYNDEECYEIFKSMLHDFMPNLKIGEGVESLFYEAIAKERKENSFGNARSVRNIKDAVAGQCFTRLTQEMSLEPGVEKESILLPEDFSKISSTSKKKEMNVRNESQIENALKQLDSLYGLDTVKSEINKKYNNVRNTMKARAKGLRINNELSLSMLFVGAPGTGKSTVGEMVSDIFYQLGYLSQNRCKRVIRSDLVGGYEDETIKKTTKILDDARGGILFIDEAYQLLGNGGNSDLGKKALEVIMDRMENDRENCTIIMAGYEDELRQLLAFNTGLESRFQTIIHFEDYDNKTCYKIFQNLLAKDLEGLLCGPGVEAKFNEVMDKFREKPNFGNARTVRNLEHSVFENALNRLGAEDFENLVIIPEDFSEM